MAIDELLGPHRQIVDHILTRFDAIVAGDVETERVVVLRAPSGLGKSRIIREVYERLRVREGAKQLGRHYWPELEAEDGEARNPLVTRKVLGPNAEKFVWPASTLPTFAWWALRCERSSSTGALLDMLSAAQNQLRPHVVPLSIRYADKANLWDRVKRKREDLIKLAGQTGWDATLDSVGTTLSAFDIALPFVGTGANLLTKGAQGIGRAWSRDRQIISDVSLGQQTQNARASIGDEIAQWIAGLAHPELPAVLALEDLHWAQPEVIDLVQRLSVRDPRRPVLVLATAWPEGELQNQGDDSYQVFLTQTRSVTTAVIEVPNLDQAERAQLVLRAAPHTDEDTLRSIAQAMPTPLILKLWLALRATRTQIERDQGALRITSEQLQVLPSSLEAVYRAQWDELSEPVQQALTLAVSATPSDDPLARFVPSILAQVAPVCGLSENDALIALQQAVDPAQWCLLADEAQSFREQRLADTARKAHPEYFDPGQLDEIQTATRDALRRLIQREIGDGYYLDPEVPSAPVASDWLVSITSGVACAADVAATWFQARRFANTFQYRTAIDILQPAVSYLKRNDPDHYEALALREDIASWLVESGETSAALAEFSNLFRDRFRTLGPSHPDTLRSRKDIASCRGDLGKPSEAVADFSRLLDDQIRVLGLHAPSTLQVRSNLVYWLGESGQVLPALEAGQELLEDQFRILGNRHRDTLITRNNIAALHGRSGNVTTALGEYHQLLIDNTQILGLDHPGTLRIRNNIACWLAESGKEVEALREFQKLFTDRARILGPNHPNTFNTRGNIAVLHSRLGNISKALEELNSLLVDRTRILGPDHPDTLNNRHEIARCFRESGQTKRSLAAFYDLLDQRLRILGPDHPETLWTRNDLSFTQAISGDISRALDGYRELFPDQRRVLGTDHERTLITLENIAYLNRQIAKQETAHSLLTVVVTCYRLGALATEMLASLRWSADPRIRFVLVDDASPDDTLERLHRAARELPGAEVLALPDNLGLAGARMAALEQLETEWFTFLDGDDWVAKGYYPALLDEVLGAGVEWVRTDHILCTGRERTLVRIPDINRHGRIGTPRDSILSARTSSVDFAHAWSGVYHRRLAEDGTVFYPPELRTAEDRPAIWRLHLTVPEFTIARTVGVHYRQAVEGSLTQTGDVRQLAVTESMRQVGEIVAADPDAERFRPKVLRTWAGLFAWHWAHRARFTPVLRARFITEAGALLDTADQDQLAAVIRAMPESRRQAVEALRRAARVLSLAPLPAVARSDR